MLYSHLQSAQKANGKTRGVQIVSCVGAGFKEPWFCARVFDLHYHGHLIKAYFLTCLGMVKAWMYSEKLKE